MLTGVWTEQIRDVDMDFSVASGKHLEDWRFMPV
jgi:hypothetical protein